ncbi:MAG TPA: hypothetical protein VHH35_07770 [Pyrinomonadaceae bacterium]|nr:hypothetical protein [Pyrinomonadaceae bacterium]
MFTLAVPVSLPKPTEISFGMRPRQSKVMVCSEVMKVTLFSSEKVCVDVEPLPSKSIVTL